LTTVSEEDELENICRFTKKNVNIWSTLDSKEYYPITSLLYIGVILASLYIVDLGQIFAILGSLWATLIAFIMPPVFFLKLQDGNALIRTNVFAFLVLMFGVTFLVVGLYSNILL
jgi:amino acid permease